MLCRLFRSPLYDPVLYPSGLLAVLRQSGRSLPTVVLHSLFSSSGNLVPFAPSLLLAIVKVAHRRLLLLYYLRVLLVYVSDTTWLEAQICT